MGTLRAAGALLLVLVAGCNGLKKTNDTAADAGATASGSASSGAGTTAAPTAATGSIADKALSFLSGGPFEGEITMSLTTAGKPPQTMAYMVKGSKMRFNTPAGDPRGAGYVIWDASGKSTTVVSDSKKTAMVMDLNGPAGGDIAAAAAAKKPTSIDQTGKTDTIAGYSCDIARVTEANGDKGEVCLTKGIAFPAFPGAGNAGWMSSLSDSFPLRAVMTDAAGKEKNRMLVTKIDKRSLDDSQFQVPAGYTTRNMADLMKGLGGKLPH